ncbi:MAG: hypothetical protein AB4426_11450 [Xenococcaceae cyanobacterium]
MKKEELVREKFDYSRRFYENSECIYKEGYTLCHARVTDIESGSDRMKAKILAIPTPGLSIPNESSWNIGACWSFFSFFDPEYWHCRLWTIYFNPTLIKEVIELASLLSRVDKNLDETEKFFELVQYINFNHELRIARLEVAAQMREALEFDI